MAAEGRTGTAEANRWHSVEVRRVTCIYVRVWGERMGWVRASVSNYTHTYRIFTRVGKILDSATGSYQLRI